jgi:hypothetical protein
MFLRIRRRRELSIFTRKDGMRKLMESGPFSINMLLKLMKMIAHILIVDLLIKKITSLNR